MAADVPSGPAPESGTARDSGVPLDGDGVVYPTWQFLDNGATIPSLAEVLATLAEGTDDAWMIALWMRAPSEDLEGEPPSGWLRNGRDPERVIAMAYQVASSWAA